MHPYARGDADGQAVHRLDEPAYLELEMFGVRVLRGDGLCELLGAHREGGAVSHPDLGESMAVGRCGGDGVEIDEGGLAAKERELMYHNIRYLVTVRRRDVPLPPMGASRGGTEKRKGNPRRSSPISVHLMRTTCRRRDGWRVRRNGPSGHIEHCSN